MITFLARRSHRDRGTSATAGTSLAKTAVAARVTTIAVWCLVACGPLALLTVAVSHAHTSSKTPTATTATGANPAGPAGFAELYVSVYLRGASLTAFYPDAPQPTGQSGVTFTAVTIAGVTETSPGYWSVTVAATEAAGIRYFMVAIDSTHAGPAYVATALPAAVAGPAEAAEPQLGYDTTVPIPSGVLTGTVTQFLAAYLTGSGSMSRYLAPGTTIGAISPAPYASIQATGIYTSSGQAPAPSSGVTVRVLAQVQATDASGNQWPLTYALTVTAVAGQWDIAAIDPVPDLNQAP